LFENVIKDVAKLRHSDDLLQQRLLLLAGTMQEYIDKLLMEIQRSKFTERRTESLQSFVRPVVIHLPHGPSIRAFSKHLSSQGIGVITENSFQPGSLATLEIHSMHGDAVLLRSEVRWCDPYGKGWYLIGWKFIGIGVRPMA
jgi:hypothetical protein